MRAAVLVPLALLMPGCAMIDGLTGGGCDATPFFQSVNTTVPDNNPTGVSSAVNVGPGIVSGVTVSSDTEHRFPGELHYELSHNGFFVDLGGEGEHEVDAFDGMQSQGFWTMRIYDSVGADEGFWYSWEIAVCIEDGSGGPVPEQ